MRELAMEEINLMEMVVAGGASVEEFNQCMADNWWHNTVVGGTSGAFAGAFFGPGAFVGGVVGVMGASTGTFFYCVF